MGYTFAYGQLDSGSQRNTRFVLEGKVLEGSPVGYSPISVLFLGGRLHPMGARDLKDMTGEPGASF